MKSMAELEAIRKKTLERINLRRKMKAITCAWWSAWLPAASPPAPAP